MPRFRSLRPRPSARAAALALAVPGFVAGGLLARTVAAQAVEHPFSFSLLPGQIPTLVGAQFAWGDVDGDGDLDLVAMGLFTPTVGAQTPYTAVLRNDGPAADALAPGGRTVRLTPVALPLALAHGSLALGDIDRDGDLDLIVSGSQSPAVPHRPRAVLYRNDGRGGFADSGVALPAVFGGSVRLADLDRDGALDIVLTGVAEASAPYQPTVSVLRQTGAWTFAAVADAGLPAMAFGDLRTIDADGDGDLDVLVSGLVARGGAAAPGGGLYLNTGGRFAPSALAVGGGALARLDAVRRGGVLDLATTSGRPFPMGLTGTGRVQTGATAGGGAGTVRPLDPLVGGAVLWTDVDADGQHDLFVAGQSQPFAPITARLLRRTGSDAFTLLGHLEGLRSGGAALGDLDGDGDLDLATAGAGRSGGAVGALYRNDQWGRATVPTPPIGLSATPEDGGLRLRWTENGDAATYAVRVGTAAGTGDLLGADAAASGWRTAAQAGPVADASFWLSPALLARGGGARVHVGVQAISAALVGSPFAEITADAPAITAADAEIRVTAWALGVPAPQPLARTGRVRIDVPAAADVSIDIADALGRTVARVHAGVLAAGAHEIALDGGALAPGLYVLRLRTPGGLVTRPLVVAR